MVARSVQARPVPRWVVAALTMAIVAVAGTDVWLLTGRGEATEVTLDDALAEFREEVATAPTPVAPAAAVPGTAPVDPTVPSAADLGAGAPTAEVPVVTAPEPTAAPETTAAPVAPLPYSALPAQGVYTYRTTGGERVSMLNTSRSYPPEIYATVRHTGGCAWEHRMDVLEEHVDITILCSEPGRVSQLSQERRIAFFGIADGAMLPCDPPALRHAADQAAGATASGSCGDGETTSALTATYLGAEPIDVGGVVVQAARVRVDGTFTGKQQGTSVDDYWIDPATGLTLRWDRSTETDAVAFGAQVHYVEEASFALVSLTSQT